jgi:hypothetical protein
MLQRCSQCSRDLLTGPEFLITLKRGKVDSWITHDHLETEGIDSKRENLIHHHIARVHVILDPDGQSQEQNIVKTVIWIDNCRMT